MLTVGDLPDGDRRVRQCNWSCEKLPARLRLTRIAQPASSKLDCIAVSAINGCEVCVRAHERVVTEGGLTEAQVLDAIGIAAVVHGAAAALDHA